MDDTEVMFSQRMNPRTGEVEWVVVDGENRNEESRFLSLGNTIAMSSYLDMLNDSERNEAYYSAIRNTLSAGNFVLDIGSGTGLLAMMSQRVLEEKEEEIRKKEDKEIDVCRKKDGLFERVTTCECFLAMAKLAHRIIRANGMQNQIKLVMKRSEDLEIGKGKDMIQHADVLVCEILDSTLLGEGMIPAIRHSKRHLLKRDAKIIPFQATVHAQVFECECLSEFYDIEELEKKMNDGIFLSHLNFKASSPWILHANYLESKLKPLSNVFQVFKFEFENICSLENKFEKINVRMHTDGFPHVITWWWDLQLDKFGKTFYSTAPFWKFSENENSCMQKRPKWKNHWRQCLTFLPLKKQFLPKNSFLKIFAAHDELGIYFFCNQMNFSQKYESIDIICKTKVSLNQKSKVTEKNDNKENELTETSFSGEETIKLTENMCLEHSEMEICSKENEIFFQNSPFLPGRNPFDSVVFRPQRFFSFFDSNKRNVLIKVVEDIMKKKENSHWLVTDDSLLLSYLTNKIHGGKKVHGHQMSSNRMLTILSPGYRQSAIKNIFKNYSPSHQKNDGDDENDVDGDAKFLCQCAKDVNEEGLRGREIDVLLAEPFYLCNEGLLPWMALRFWYDVFILQKYLSKPKRNAYIFPSMAILRAVVVSVPDAWRSRVDLKEVCGFDHSFANPILNPQPPQNQKKSKKNVKKNHKKKNFTDKKEKKNQCENENASWNENVVANANVNANANANVNANENENDIVNVNEHMDLDAVRECSMDQKKEKKGEEEERKRNDNNDNSDGDGVGEDDDENDNEDDDDDDVDMSHGKPLPFSACQCGEFEELSDHFTLMSFQFSQPPQRQKNKVNVSFNRDGDCHALFVWLDFGSLYDPSLILSMAPTADLERINLIEQGVQFLHHPIRVKNKKNILKQEKLDSHKGRTACKNEYEAMDVYATFDPDRLNLDFKIYFH